MRESGRVSSGPGSRGVGPEDSGPEGLVGTRGRRGREAERGGVAAGPEGRRPGYLGNDPLALNSWLRRP